MSRSPEDSNVEGREPSDGWVSDRERRIRNLRADGPGLVSHLPGMVYQARLEPRWPMEFASPAALPLTGYPPRTFLLGGDPAFGDLIQEEDRDQVWAEVLDAVEENRIFSLEYRIRHRSGDIRHVWDQGHAVPAEDGEILGVEGFILDITERVALTERLRDAQRRETVGRVSGVVAHDFNNFLTGIIGSLELARTEVESGSRVRELVDLALESAERARQLTRQLLLLSRGRPHKRSLIDLNARVREFHGFLAQIVGSPVSLTLDLEEGTLPLHVDPALVDQVLLNLVVNAREAIAGYGRIEIRTRSQAGAVTVLVSDDGCGMDEETRGRVFDPFFTTKDSGTGLGLATVKEIVDEVGGQLAVESRAGQGTTFEIAFPRAPSQVAEVSPEPRAREGNRDPAGEVVLVVDDDETVLRVIRRALERFGYRVLEAGDPASCRRVIEKLDTAPDLALMDVTLPETSGIALARELREEGLLERVLFMSGYAAEDFVEGAEALRDSHYLEKPFSVDDLVSAVSRALDADDRSTGTGAA